MRRVLSGAPRRRSWRGIKRGAKAFLHYAADGSGSEPGDRSAQHSHLSAQSEGSSITIPKDEFEPIEPDEEPFEPIEPDPDPGEPTDEAGRHGYGATPDMTEQAADG
ncbi:UNVERIFIED_CONTAM: hypothetical protein OHV15_00925 [Microbacterium sp. SLM126]